MTQSYWHLRATLRDLVIRHGSIGAAAKALGIHRPALSRALAGQPPRPSVLRAIGWEAVTTYRPIQTPDEWPEHDPVDCSEWAQSSYQCLRCSDFSGWIAKGEIPHLWPGPCRPVRKVDTQAQLRDIAARIQALLAVDNPPPIA